MPVLRLSTTIHAPVERCFDLARSIDLHKESTKHTSEEAIAGVTSGLIGLNETVTWRARHFWITQTLTSQITAYQRPDYFVDEMVEGAFRKFRHEHHFNRDGERTVMTDVFDYESPAGILGKLADKLFLKNYMFGLLEKRNNVIREIAESNRWQELIP